MKLFLRILLSFYLFLFGGIGYLNATSQQFSDSSLTARHTSGVAHIARVAIQNGLRPSISFGKPHPHAQSYRLKAMPLEEDEDENEKNSASKKTGVGNHLSGPLLYPSPYLTLFTRHLPFCEHFSCLSSFLNILFCTLRI